MKCHGCNATGWDFAIGSHTFDLAVMFDESCELPRGCYCTLVDIARYSFQVSVDIDPYVWMGSHLSNKARFQSAMLTWSRSFE